ncbi:unnamed protein product [Dicrocoelium dendriticum]|nr:unnamed protein product [Dicrocoelium dendriticum]
MQSVADSSLMDATYRVMKRLTTRFVTIALNISDAKNKLAFERSTTFYVLQSKTSLSPSRNALSAALLQRLHSETVGSIRVAECIRNHLKNLRFHLSRSHTCESDEDHTEVNESAETHSKDGISR